MDGVDLRMVSGVDAGLREGNASYAITVDLADEQAYRVYDRDPEHNRIRAEMFAPITERESACSSSFPAEPGEAR